MVVRVECCGAKAQAPDRSDWLIDRANERVASNYSDYGVVTRFLDSDTGKIAIVVAGEGRGGTIVAGEFLIDPGHLARWSLGLRIPRANGIWSSC
jgi:hypothetical protein